jgi:hypothetical protein
LYNQEVEDQIYNLSKIVLSQEGETWLVRINDQPKIVEVLVAEDVGCDVPDAIDILAESIEELILQISILPGWHEHNFEVHQHREVQLEETIPQPRVLRSSRLKKPRVSTETSVKPNGPIKKTIAEASTDPDKHDAVQPIKIDPKSSNFNKFEVDPIKSWIGKQLKDQTISQSILGNVIKTHDNYPDGLLAIPFTKGGPPRITVPVEAQENLVKQAYLDIHHQNHRKVYPLYWWPFMAKEIERICKACDHCQSGKMRREKIKSEFDALGPQSKAGPRQHYGMDFYGLMKGEVLVIVDLFTRETILQWIPSRKQEQFAHTILRRVIF